MYGLIRKDIAEGSEMKKSIITNAIISGLILLYALIFPFSEIVYDWGPVILFVLTTLILCLTVVNILKALKRWRRHKTKSLIPLALIAFAVVSFIPAARLGSILSEIDTPLHPVSYFSEDREHDMTELAEALLDYPINEIREGYDSMEIFTNDNVLYQDIDFEPIKEKLRNSDFHYARVDYVQKIVRLYSRKHRIWCNYIYARSGLGYPYTTMPCKITDADILDWNEIIKIACVRYGEAYRNKGCFSFLPTITYPLLEKGINEELLDKLSYIDNTDSLSSHERQAIIDMLNKQRHASSKLIENSKIRYGFFEGSSGLPEETLKLDYASIGDKSWITELLRELINRDVIIIVDNEGHMKIKHNLSEPEELSVEWLHAGILNVIYGNFLGKEKYTFVTILSDKWYYCPPESSG